MFTTIVVPLDGSEFAARAIPAAAAFARTSEAFLHFVGIASSDAELAWTYDHVHDQARAVPPASVPDVDILVDPDPTNVLLEMAADRRNVLCFATHDHPPVAAKVMHSVGSTLTRRARQPFIAVGSSSAPTPGATDVVVAVDGVTDPEPLLTVGSQWARRLRAPLRIVTVYEPVLPDLRRPTHVTRQIGPPTDADIYLGALARNVESDGTPVSTVSIADPVSVSAGLADHLASRPAQLIVVGGRTHGVHLTERTVPELLRTVATPLLVVNPTLREGVTA